MVLDVGITDVIGSHDRIMWFSLLEPPKPSRLRPPRMRLRTRFARSLRESPHAGRTQARGREQPL